MDENELKIRSRYEEFKQLRTSCRGVQNQNSIVTSSDGVTLTMPAWSRIPLDFHSAADNVAEKINRLSDLHTNFLKPRFSREEEEQRLLRQIDIETTEIRSYLKTLEHLVFSATVIPGSASDGEVRIIQNIRICLSNSLKELGQHFKYIQEAYSTQLRRRERKENKYMKIGSDAGYGVVHQEERIANLLQLGFTEEDSQALIAEEIRQEQTGKEVKEILDSINEIQTMFEDLRSMVVEQGTMLDRIDYNVEQALVSASTAQIELEKARERQNSCILM